VPNSIKQVIRLLVGHYFNNHEAVGPSSQTPIALGVENLLRPFTPLVLA
jgi:hypothetical protein